MAQQTPTVPAVMLSQGDPKLGTTFITIGAVTPGRFLGQHVQKPEEKLFSCYLIVEDIDPLIVIDAQTSSSSHYSPTQVGISLHVG